VLLAGAVFLASGAAGLMMDETGSLYAIGVGFPIGITVAFVGVGIGLADYVRETMFSVLVLPPALWGFFYLMNELDFVKASTWGYGMAALAIVCLLRAAVPSKSEG
jgi:hypothetical protein